MLEIYMIRHGQASFRQPGYDRLSAVGERQAQLLGRHFSATQMRFDAVFCGSLKRHVQTATLALEQMNGDGLGQVVVDADFNEFDGSDTLMGDLAALIEQDPALQRRMAKKRTHPDVVGRLFEIAEQARILPQDEAVRQQQAEAFRNRIGRALDNLLNTVGDNGKVAVFTSGGPTAVALRRALQTSREQTLRLGRELRNTSVTVLRHDKGQLGLVLFNSVTHLEHPDDPGLITYI